jgi:hypothetical protein
MGQTPDASLCPQMRVRYRVIRDSHEELTTLNGVPASNQSVHGRISAATRDVAPAVVNVGTRVAEPPSHVQTRYVNERAHKGKPLYAWHLVDPTVAPARLYNAMFC